MTEPKKPGFDFSAAELLASGIHAQLLARRRATLEHDVKNVLHGLMSGTELLSKALTATSGRITPAECVTLLQQQLGRAQTTLHRMLDEVAPPDHSVADIDVGELLVECTHALRHQLQMLDVHTTAPSGLKVRLVRSRFKDALLCVLLDCVDRMPPRSRIAIDARAGDGQVLVSIQHAHSDAAATSAIDTVAQVLAADEVRLVASSSANIRTVELHIARIAEAASVGELDLLVVDANRDAADSIAMLTQLEGFNTETAYDAARALELLKTRAPKVVLIDLEGAIDNRSLVRTIRSANGQQPRIAGLSHSPIELADGIDANLHKPLDPAELRRLLK